MNNLPMAIYLDGDLGSLDPRISWRRCWGQTWTTGRNRARCPEPIHGRGPPVTGAAVGSRWATPFEAPDRGRRPHDACGGHRMPGWAPAVWIPAAACRALAFSGPVGAPVAAPASRCGTYTWKVTPCGPGIRSLQAALCAFLRRYARSIRESGRDRGTEVIRKFGVIAVLGNTVEYPPLMPPVVDVAQLVEPRIVDPVVVGSSPIIHPKSAP